jgi:hypothetical protein
MIFRQIPVLYSQKKTEKNSKKRLLGPKSRSKLCENGPEIVEQKNTLLHIVSRTQRPEKIKKFDPYIIYVPYTTHLHI